MSCHHGCYGCCDHGTSEALKRSEDRNSSLISQNTSLQSQLSSKNTEVSEKNNQIIAVNSELTTTKNQLVEAKGELTVTRKDLKDLGELFNNLKIESNNKDREIEIKIKDVKNLKVELDKSQEEIFNYKLKEQEKKLDDFIQKIGVSREKPRELRKAYQRLIKARENYNQDNITEAEDDIEMIKDELLSGG